ncbi:MAG TPA: GYD domain-containing protein [Vicinamibacteria bacterium]|nr:GYD domain-containing protein [Vicinamibacteria bacterium]HXV60815.1 GYD domain-containing protein [Vicinamibacteria bacterium]
MPTFVLMTKLSPETMGDPRGMKQVGKTWLQKVSQHCPGVKWIAHYALLGRYDFMDIYEAPDFETAHKVSYISRAEGALDAESWQAVPYEDYVELVDDLK